MIRKDATTKKTKSALLDGGPSVEGGLEPETRGVDGRPELLQDAESVERTRVTQGGEGRLQRADVEVAAERPCSVELGDSVDHRRHQGNGEIASQRSGRSPRATAAREGRVAASEERPLGIGEVRGSSCLGRPAPTREG